MAAGLQQPLLVIPLAFVSHFFLDMIPHFGIHEHDATQRNKSIAFCFMLAIDIVLAVTLLAFLPTLLHHAIKWWVVLIGMLAAWLPDAIWIRHFVHDIRGKVGYRKGRFAAFHQKIQWFERPPGLVVELVWFGAMTVFLGLFATIS